LLFGDDAGNQDRDGLEVPLHALIWSVDGVREGMCAGAAKTARALAICANRVSYEICYSWPVEEYTQIHWVGDSKEGLSAFPQEVKSLLGYSLRRVQKGLLPDCDARRMESIGKGVWELKAADERTWYRVIYLAKVGNAVYILHAFEKSSRKTDRRDLAVAKARLASVAALLR
jgi:phage-related protein